MTELLLHWSIFKVFLMANLLGYGGGPAIIPLIEAEVVGHYQWLTVQEFSEILALGNALPSPIATKMAAHIGYQMAGVTGAVVALTATIVPSLVLMLCFMGVINKYRHHIRVKRITIFVQPVIAVMMAILTWKFLFNSYTDIGWIHSLVLLGFAVITMEKMKWHPALTIACALLYGAFFIRE